jgi:uncharacterized protein (TIGR02246 family)
MSESRKTSEIHALEKDWCEAWNRRDVPALSSLLTADADFVTVAGDWLKGRAQFAAFHEAVLATIFRHSVFAITSTRVSFVQADLAIAHVRWKIKGDRNLDGTLRKPRKGIFTQVLTKSRGKWLIRASQNTNEDPVGTDEFLGLLKRRNWI